MLDRSVGMLRSRFPGLTSNKSLLMRLGRALDDAMTGFLQEMFAPFGLTEAELYTLVLVYSLPAGDATPGHLCALIAKSPALMTRCLVSLERMDLVVRKPDETDRRITRVRLTPAGRRKVEETFPAASRKLDDALSGMADAEIAMLEALLRKAVRSVDQAAARLHAASRGEGT